VRILQLSWEYPPLVYGGLGRHVHALAEAQAALGHDVTVLTQAVDGEPPDSVVSGVRVVRVPLDPPAIPQSDLLAWVLALGHAVGRAGVRLAGEPQVDIQSPQVVHAHDWLMAHPGTLLKEALGVPLVATLHATEAGRHQGWLPGPMSQAIHTTEWWLTYEARRVITCSAAMQWEVTRLFDLPPGKVDVISNGIDLASWSAPSRRAVSAARTQLAGDGPLLVFVGRLEWEKGIHTLLDAMPRLRRRHPGIRLVVAGEGTFGEELRTRARRLRLGASVTFLGRLPDVSLRSLLAAADCAVVPSLYEPFGLVALEAAALGAPLVVADVGGLRDLVAPGVSGLRFPAGDVAGLADAVSTVLRNDIQARRMARAAFAALGRDHAWPSLAERTVETYTRAVVEERDLVAGHHAAATRARSGPVIGSGNLLRDEPSF
jgi:glycogen synthase